MKGKTLVFFLIQMAGDEALENENYAHALELYHLSKVDGHNFNQC